MTESLWKSLEESWRVSLEEAWAAYCAGTVPIGAVIIDEAGKVLARGRNRILKGDVNEDSLKNRKLLHAELQALLGLDETKLKKKDTKLYSTMEPCPLCFGAWYMSGVRAVHFAARDPYAGSTNLLGTTWYMQWKNRQVYGPVQGLEELLIAMQVEFEGRVRGRFDDIVLQRWKEALPQAVEFGQELAQAGTLKGMMEDELPVSDVIDQLAGMYASI